jgi:hypothetical protein
MSLPRIKSLVPTVVPAIPAKPEIRYDDAFMTGMELFTMPDSPMRVKVTLENYNYDINELDPNGTTNVVNFPDVREEAAISPVVAQVMGGVPYVVNLLCAKQRLTPLLANARTNQSSTEASLTTLNQQKQALIDAMTVLNDEQTTAQAALDTANAMEDGDAKTAAQESANAALSDVQGRIQQNSTTTAEVDALIASTESEVTAAQAATDALKSELMAVYSQLQIQGEP